LSGNNTFTGAVPIPAGTTLKVVDSHSLGATTGVVGDVTVASGATLDVGSNNSLAFGTRHFHIQGTGVGGIGAIFNSNPNIQTTVFNFVTLDGDALIAGQRMDISIPGLLDLQGHTLTLAPAGASNHIFQIAVPVTAGNILLSTGSLGLGSDANIPSDTSGSTITFATGTSANFVAN